MVSFRKIGIIARYEIKTLFRSWFFRIFSGLALVILVSFDISVITDTGGSPWMFRGIPANIPYANLFMLNIAQAIIAAFLASEFLKRDYKQDTTEVVYMRSMTNGDYIIGKTTGILVVFLLLNLVVLLVAGIMNLFSQDTPVDLLSYLIYPVLISIPTLVFILGLSFILMLLIRNQAVTIVVLLGYIATVLFYLGKKFYFHFDYMVFYLPMIRSEFVGFGNPEEVLVQRGIYLLLGSGFIFLTILFFRRLPQSIPMTRFSFLAVILCLCGAALLTRSFITKHTRGKNLRAEMVSLNNQHLEMPHVQTTHCDLDLYHTDDSIRCTARMKFRNNNQERITAYVFTLNPGLTVTGVVKNGKPLGFSRNVHLLFVTPEELLSPGSDDSIVIHYAGKINEEAAYIDIDESYRSAELRVEMFSVDRRYSFLTRDFVLLTKEVLWYPEAGVNYCSIRPGYNRREFVTYTLRVSTQENLSACSQGAVLRPEPGRYTFIPETPLPQISLIIGEMTPRTVTVDSISYNLVTLTGHDYFLPYTDELGDTLPVLLTELKQDYERDIQLPYVFPRFSLIEVPIQFTSYPRRWTMNQETVQPEMVFLPENGLPIWQADLKRAYERQEQQAKRNNQIISKKELQAKLVGQFIRAIITTGDEKTWFSSEDHGYGKSAYSIYSNYFYFVYFLRSERSPIVNMGMEAFLDRIDEGSVDLWRRNWQGLSDEEQTNLALQGKNFSQLLTDPNTYEIIHPVIRMKGSYLFTLLESKTGGTGFRETLLSVLEKNRFTVLDIHTLGEELKEKYSLDIENQIDDWYLSDHLPGFVITGIRTYEFVDENRTRYQVRFHASNPEAAEGLFMITFRTGDKDSGSSSDAAGSKIVYLEPGQTKEIGVVLDIKPRAMTINTMISRNIPSVIESTFGDFEKIRRAVPFDGENLIGREYVFEGPGEIIVDNEDPEFEMVQASGESYLRKWIRKRSKKEEQKYTGVRWWRPPGHWQAITQSEFYGKYIRSAYYTRSGTGERMAIWKCAMKDAGFYDVFVHFADPTAGMYKGGDQDRATYHYQVFHDNGMEETVLELQNAETGWNFLGSYYISTDTARVQITNDSAGRMVVADAVKWVKQ